LASYRVVFVKPFDYPAYVRASQKALSEYASQSGLGIASAASSNVGSPYSDHGQLLPIPEWRAAFQPGEKVESWDFPGGEYCFSPPTMDIG